MHARWRSCCLEFGLVLGVLGLPGALVRAQALDYRIGPPPDWVIPVERGVANEKRLGQISDGAYYLLSDSQTRLEAGQRVSYRHVASKAVNAAGVSTLANLEFGFDPAYQSLELHSIDLIREGRVIPKLATATVRVLQRETELERRIYDGSKSASIFLEDVRVGDILDYAYTVRGRNPVFQGRDFGVISLQYSVPIARIHARLIAPQERPLAIAARGTGVEAKTSLRNGQREYQWDLRDIPALNVENDTPGWYDPYPVVQWSEFEDWAAVNRWAQPLYAVPKKISPALQLEVDRIRRTALSPEDRLLAVLRFAQGEIRYLGVEIGPGSHEPNPPDLVFERRFGDCKDKTLLTMTLLDRFGIKAQAALVNTQKRRALEKRQPSPGQFDHVIVRAELDGKTFWLDPTRATQNADLAHLMQPDFDLALVIGPDTRGLVSMEQKDAPASTRQVHVTFDATDGLEEPVDFRVVTTVEGENAESMRYTLSTANFEELQKLYLNFYTNTFPGLSIVEPMQVKDDERNNRIRYTEHYRIPDFSEWSEASNRHTANVSVPDVDELLRSPNSTVRNAPLRLAHPSDVTVITETVLPSAWKIEPSTARVEDPAFTFERTIKPKGERIFITDRYKSLADEVAAADTQRYASNLARAREETAYQLYWSNAAAVPKASGIDRVNWMIVLIALMVLAIWTWLARKVYRFDPPASGADPRSPLRGLGGWLIVPAFGMMIVPFVTFANLHANIGVWATDSWASLTTFGGANYHVMWAPVLLFELVSILGTFVFGVTLLVLFFRRRSSFPKVYIAVQWMATAQLLADSILLRAIPDADIKATNIPELVGGLIGVVIWTLYFLQSERVRNTFVERLKKPEPAASEVPAVPAVPVQGFSL